MMIRRHHESLLVSFNTTKSIPATKAALYEYMQQHHSGRPFTAAELSSVKFRHRNSFTNRGDVNPVIKDLRVQWRAPWAIRYIRDEDRAEADKAAKITGLKARYSYTEFGFCSQFPVA